MGAVGGSQLQGPSPRRVAEVNGGAVKRRGTQRDLYWETAQSSRPKPALWEDTDKGAPGEPQVAQPGCARALVRVRARAREPRWI